MYVIFDFIVALGQIITSNGKLYASLCQQGCLLKCKQVINNKGNWRFNSLTLTFLNINQVVITNVCVPQIFDGILNQETAFEITLLLFDKNPQIFSYKCIRHSCIFCRKRLVGNEMYYLNFIECLFLLYDCKILLSPYDTRCCNKKDCIDKFHLLFQRDAKFIEEFKLSPYFYKLNDNQLMSFGRILTQLELFSKIKKIKNCNKFLQRFSRRNGTKESTENWNQAVRLSYEQFTKLVQHIKEQMDKRGHSGTFELKFQELTKPVKIKNNIDFIWASIFVYKYCLVDMARFSRASMTMEMSRKTISKYFYCGYVLGQNYFTLNFIGEEYWTQEKIQATILPEYKILFGPDIMNYNVSTWDGGDIEVQRAIDFQIQHLTYSMKSDFNAYRFMYVGSLNCLIFNIMPHFGVPPTGFHNDNGTIDYLITTNCDNIKNWLLKRKSLIIADRGFRDALIRWIDETIDVILPCCVLNKNLDENHTVKESKQQEVLMSNLGRFDTIVRWSIEAIIGHLTKRYGIFQKCPNNLTPVLGPSLKFCGAVHNMFKIGMIKSSENREILYTFLKMGYDKYSDKLPITIQEYKYHIKYCNLAIKNPTEFINVETGRDLMFYLDQQFFDENNEPICEFTNSIDHTKFYLSDSDIILKATGCGNIKKAQEYLYHSRHQLKVFVGMKAYNKHIIIVKYICKRYTHRNYEEEKIRDSSNVMIQYQKEGLENSYNYIYGNNVLHLSEYCTNIYGTRSISACSHKCTAYKVIQIMLDNPDEIKPFANIETLHPESERRITFLHNYSRYIQNMRKKPVQELVQTHNRVNLNDN